MHQAHASGVHVDAKMVFAAGVVDVSGAKGCVQARAHAVATARSIQGRHRCCRHNMSTTP